MTGYSTSNNEWFYLFKGGMNLLKAVPQEKTYDGSIFAKTLGVTSSTLRNYKSHFVKAGISFKMKNGKTVYTETNLQMFKAMLDLYKQGGKTIAECVHAVLASVHPVQDSVLTVQDTVHAVQQYEDKVQDSLKQMEERLQQMQQYIDTKLADRDKQLMGVIKELQEIKAAQRKKKWWQFWR